MRTPPEVSRPAWLRYAVAVLASVAGLALAALFRPVFEKIPFMSALLAVFVSGWFGGGGPSLLAAVLSALGIDYFFFLPVSSLRIEDPYDGVRIFVFLAVGSACSLMFARLWANRRHRAQLIERAERARGVAETATREVQQILESITDGFCAVDRAYRYKYVNRQAEEILGLSRGHLIGKSALEDYPLTQPGLDALRSAMEERQPSHAEVFHPSLRRWIASDVYPSSDGVSILFRDISDRKQAEEGLQRLAAIVESSEDAIIAKDLDGTITAWNAGAERLFGYSAEEIIGRPISVLMPEHRNDMDEILAAILRGERVEHFETKRVKKNGEIVPVSLSVSPIKDAADRIVGAAKIARDISEQKRQQAERERLYNEAREAARVREEFLSVAGHELRTPLTSLQFQLHTLQRRLEAGQTERAAEVLGRARAQLQRLARLTEELLDVTRITSGQLTLESEEMDLGQVAQEVAERYKDAAQRAGSEIRIEAHPGATGVWDRSRLDQVMTNLLSNAVKFGNARPIEISVEPDTLWVRLTVRDHGIGISPEGQSKIFERFERAASKRSYGGLGLGLWISRQIVEAHGGRIEVSSKPGEGSTFRVELPRDMTKGAAV